MLVYLCEDCKRSLKTIEDDGGYRSCPYCGGMMKKMMDL